MAEEKKAPVWKKVVDIAVNVICIVIVAAVFYVSISNIVYSGKQYVGFFGRSYLSVQTPSMQWTNKDSFAQGDVIAVKLVRSASDKTGEFKNNNELEATRKRVSDSLIKAGVRGSSDGVTPDGTVITYYSSDAAQRPPGAGSTFINTHRIQRIVYEYRTSIVRDESHHVAYQWQIKQDGEWIDLPFVDGEPVAGATAQKLTLEEADRQYTYRMKATVTDLDAAGELKPETQTEVFDEKPTLHIQSITTRGDARVENKQIVQNDVNDSSRVSAEQVIGIYNGKAGGIGYVLTWMRTTPGFMVCIMVPAILVIAYCAFLVVKQILARGKSKVKSLEADLYEQAKKEAEAELYEQAKREAMEELMRQQGLNGAAQSDEKPTDSSDEPKND